jgi:hypothetical protein
MEEHVVNEAHAAVRSLQESREELRRVLLPRGPNPQMPPGHFPRSDIMRFLLNPRRRKLGVILVSAIFLLLRRRGGRGVNWLQLLQPLLGLAR